MVNKIRFDATVSNQYVMEKSEMIVDGIRYLIPEKNIKVPPAPDGTKTYNSASGVVTTHADSTAAFASETDDIKVITSRQDLHFAETFEEKVTDKDIVVVGSDVQSEITTYKGISTELMTTLGIGQGYSALGEWDTTTEGRAIRWSTLTEAQKEAIITDPTNNIYYDAETDEYVQARYRMRVEEGKGDFTDFERQITGDVGLMKNETNNSVGIALIQRLNQGAYHPVFNSEGCRSWLNNADADWKWYENKGGINSTSQCFNRGYLSLPSAGYRFDSGNIGNLSGRTDQYEYYDAIYKGQVKDLRLNANILEVNQAREDATRKAVSGEMRGWGKVPFTKIYDNTVDVEDGYTVVTQSLSSKIVAMKWLTSQYDSLPCQDIVGDPANIQATFPNGVLGQWIPHIPDNTVPAQFNRKVNGNTNGVRSTNNGATWIGKDPGLDPILNVSIDWFYIGEVALLQYETLSDFTETANNSVVVGSVGDVIYGNSSEISKGCRLSESTSGVIGKSTNNLYSVIISENEHIPIKLTGDKNAFKTLVKIVEKDGLLYAQYNWREMIYDAGGIPNNLWGDTMPGTTYTQPYGTVPITDGESTMVDLNGMTVKFGCHHSMIPIGIAKK